MTMTSGEAACTHMDINTHVDLKEKFHQVIPMFPRWDAFCDFLF